MAATHQHNGVVATGKKLTPYSINSMVAIAQEILPVVQCVMKRADVVQRPTPGVLCV